MENKYLTLFIEMAQATELTAEKVMDYNHQKHDADGERTAEIMRNDFRALKDKLSAKDFTLEQLTKSEWAKLLVGAMIITNNIQDSIDRNQKTVNSYKINLIPKLDRMVNETNSDEEAAKLVKEIFEN